MEEQIRINIVRLDGKSHYNLEKLKDGKSKSTNVWTTDREYAYFLKDNPKDLELAIQRSRKEWYFLGCLFLICIIGLIILS